MVETLNNAKNKNINILIFKYNNTNLSNKTRSYNINILGLKMIDWIKLACKNFKTKVINLNQNISIIQNVLPHAKKTGYTAVFFCDTPLLTMEGVQEIIDYATFKQLKVVTLPRGYVFSNEFLHNFDELIIPQNFNHRDNEFFIVKDFKDLVKATSILQQYINEKHQKNGVHLINSSSIFIDFNCEIKKGAIIYPNNILKNKTKILSDAIILPNNILDNCLIKEKSQVYNSFLTNCIVAKNTKVKPFSHHSNIHIKE